MRLIRSLVTKNAIIRPATSIASRAECPLWVIRYRRFPHKRWTNVRSYFNSDYFYCIAARDAMGQKPTRLVAPEHRDYWASRGITAALPS